MASVEHMEESLARSFSARPLKPEPLIKPGNVLVNKETFQSLLEKVAATAGQYDRL